MDESNLTIEEYIELKAEKAHRRGQTFKWDTTTYSKVRYRENINYFRDFETDIPAIIYDDALTTNHEVSSEPTVIPFSNNEIDFRISLDESDDEDCICIYDKISFSYKLISINDLKKDSEKDIDEVNLPCNDDIEQLDNDIYYNVDTQSNDFKVDFETNHDAHARLPAKDRRHAWLRYEDPLYTDEIFMDFKQRLSVIFTRQVWTLLVLSAFCLREIATKADLKDYWIEISSTGNFLTGVPSYTAIRDSLRRLCHRLITFNIFERSHAPEKMTATDLFYLRNMDQGAVNLPNLLAIYLFMHAEGRKQRSMMSKGHFIGRLVEHFGLLTEDRLRGLTVVIPDLTRIDKDEMAPTVALGPRTMPQRTARHEEEVYKLRENLGEQREVLGSMSRDFAEFTTWTVGRLA
ncbi:hypothetical protein Tco_0956861 [Tanacetum coccineum]